ncbi:MAG: hypothetical protein DSO08_03470, partial [Candidatus Methanomethylicota archaeon]
MQGAYMGKILRVNLTDKKVSESPLPEEYVMKYLGGRGIAARLLYDIM